MKAKRRRTEIRIETHEIKVVRFSKRRSSRFCGKCGKDVPVLVMENAVGVMDLAIPELDRLVQIENVHLVDVSDSSVLICGSSIVSSKGIE
jgi:hypothetical protein